MRGVSTVNRLFLFSCGIEKTQTQEVPIMLRIGGFSAVIWIPLLFSVRDRENLNARNDNDGEAEKSYRPMDFVRGVIDKDGQDPLHPYYSNQRETDADYVHIKMLRNNTFVTVTDSKGNIKLSGSVGSVKEMKSGQKLARYAAEATSEVVGRRARGLG
ncbi:hypothetical protein PIB30_100304, partial [Stylosanthes scabra]|nr:hypothetical protein [Stylosanthes scabra]